MVLRLAVQLDMPLRQQNRMLLAAGFAPISRAAGRRHRVQASDGSDRDWY